MGRISLVNAARRRIWLGWAGATLPLAARAPTSLLALGGPPCVAVTPIAESYLDPDLEGRNEWDEGPGEPGEPCRPPTSEDNPSPEPPMP